MSTLLKRGSRGAAVRDLQTRLNSAGATPPLVIDGDFGPATDRALRTFQTNAGLVVDGLAGAQTQTALRQATAPVRAGRQEPSKGAMADPVPSHETHGRAEPPPNATSFKLLDTSRPISELIWHCAATPEGKDFTVADIRAWHKQRGWSDIGYHFVVYRDGRIMTGRPIGQIGSHVAGRNTGTIGACYIGGVSSDGKHAMDTRSGPQRGAMLWLTERLIAKFPSIKLISGHNRYAAKACPSFDVRKDPLGALI